MIDSMPGSAGRWRTKHLSSDNGRLAKVTAVLMKLDFLNRGD